MSWILVIARQCFLKKKALVRTTVNIIHASKQDQPRTSFNFSSLLQEFVIFPKQYFYFANGCNHFKVNGFRKLIFLFLKGFIVKKIAFQQRKYQLQYFEVRFSWSAIKKRLCKNFYRKRDHNRQLSFKIFNRRANRLAAAWKCMISK